LTGRNHEILEDLLTVVRSLLAAAVLVAGAVAMRPAPAEAQYRAPVLEYGIGAFPMGHPEATEYQFDQMVAAGLKWARIPVQWKAIEGSCNDCYNFAELDRVVAAAQARGIRLIAKIDHQPAWARQVPVENGPPDNPEDYADIVAQVVGRYGSAGIPVIEVWNEPNLSREWGNVYMDEDTATDYVYLLRRAYEQAKLKDPNITILSAGLAPTGTADGSAQPDDVYLQWMYEKGLARYTDGIGMIANGFGIPPETAVMSDPSRPHPSFYYRHLEQLRQIMVANGDAGKQAWIMEHGYTTDQTNPLYSWHAVPDEATKGTYIVRALQYARANWPWVAQITIWTLADPEWGPGHEQYWWAVTEPDGTPRESYTIIQQARTNGTLP
jgi:polysaccharide biosynthesis protein PslG